MYSRAGRPFVFVLLWLSVSQGFNFEHSKGSVRDMSGGDAQHAKHNQVEVEQQAVMRRGLDPAARLQEQEQVPQAQKRQHSLLQRVTHAANDENTSATMTLLRAFRPCAVCLDYQRIGERYDGGYVMCTEGDGMSNISAAYSFGVEGRDGWGATISQRLGALPVFEFDCYDSTRPQCENPAACDLRFKEECLADGAPTGKFKSLHDHLKSDADIPRKFKSGGADLLVKMDVEGAEWSTLMNAQVSDLQRMRQLVVEFHSLDQVHAHGYYAASMRKVLDAGLVVAHIHGNNWGPLDLFGDGEFSLPDAVEVTFVNKRSFPNLQMVEGCETQQDYLWGIDKRNNVFDLELPRAMLPSDGDPEGIPDQSDGNTVTQCRYFCFLARFFLRPHQLLCSLFIFGAVIALAVLALRLYIFAEETEQEMSGKCFTQAKIVKRQRQPFEDPGDSD